MISVNGATARWSHPHEHYSTLWTTQQGEPTVNIKRTVQIGLAAFALTLATSTLTLTAPTPTAQAAPADDMTTVCCTLGHWDVGVKFVGAAFRPEAKGDGEDVAFQIENLGSTVNY